MSAETVESREELERLQAELSSRRSIVHYAHAAVALLATLILGSALAKLYVDQDRLVGWENSEWRTAAYGLAAVAAGTFLYAAVRAVIGRGAMKREAQKFERLQAMRRKFNLDDPSALLPR